MTYTLIQVHFEDSRLQHSIVVTRLARESGGPNSILTPWKIKLFSFSFLLFLHVYFNVQSVLSVPTSQNTEILCRFSHNELSNADPLDFLIRSLTLYVKTDLIFESLYDT